MITKYDLDKLEKTISDYNKGVDAFETLLRDYPEITRTVLGKDETLKEYIVSNNIRTILGNKVEIALGKKEV